MCSGAVLRAEGPARSSELRAYEIGCGILQNLSPMWVEIARGSDIGIASSSSNPGKMTLNQDGENPTNQIAIVGLACRYPGDVSTPTEFWDLLEKGRSQFVQTRRRYGNLLTM